MIVWRCSELPLGVGAPIQCPVCPECPGAPIQNKKGGGVLSRSCVWGVTARSILYAIRNGARRCRTPLDTGECAHQGALTHPFLTPLRFERMAVPLRHWTDSALSASIYQMPSHRRRLLHPALRPRPGLSLPQIFFFAPSSSGVSHSSLLPTFASRLERSSAASRGPPS
jgi:hypothetical protein